MAGSEPQTESVTSTDGTTIGYRRSGSGPGVVLVHGGMQTSYNFTKLAAALSQAFTVYVPDRRGRHGMSGSAGSDYGIEREIDDLRALLERTGARNVFGLSSGAVIALQAALAVPGIDRLALYEPPLPVNGRSTTAWVGRYERELAAGDLASAFITTIKGTGDSTAVRLAPRFLLAPAIRHFIRADARVQRPTGDIPFGDLIPTMAYDARLVRQSSGPLARFADVRCEVLLLGGARSARYLTDALNALERVLPRVRRVSFPRIGHLAADNSGRPEAVAAALQVFFSAPPPVTTSGGQR